MWSDYRGGPLFKRSSSRYKIVGGRGRRLEEDIWRDLKVRGDHELVVCVIHRTRHGRDHRFLCAAWFCTPEVYVIHLSIMTVVLKSEGLKKGVSEKGSKFKKSSKAGKWSQHSLNRVESAKESIDSIDKRRTILLILAGIDVAEWHHEHRAWQSPLHLLGRGPATAVEGERNKTGGFTGRRVERTPTTAFHPCFLYGERHRPFFRKLIRLYSCFFSQLVYSPCVYVMVYIPRPS